MAADNDLRDALIVAFTEWDLSSGSMNRAKYVAGLADKAVYVFRRWAADEPDDSKALNA
jgi:ABC-type siderophore export system fused ATPase/permease subunit